MGRFCCNADSLPGLAPPRPLAIVFPELPLPPEPRVREIPEWAKCYVCGGRMWEGRCRRKWCNVNSERTASDWRAIQDAAAEQVDGPALMFTLTAPGAAGGLPFDPELCRDKQPHRCSGPHGCRVNPDVAAAYNLTVAARLRALKNHVAADFRRLYPHLLVDNGRGGSTLPVETIHVNEEKRGVWHTHGVAASSWSNRPALDAYVRLVGKHRARYGFGGQWHAGMVFENARFAVSYMLKYLRKGGIHRIAESIAQAVDRAPVNPDTGRKPQLRPFVVSPRLQRASGVTMRSLQARRVFWAAGKLALMTPLEQTNCWAILDTFPGSVWLEDDLPPPF